MNTGLVDSVVLGEALARVVNGEADEAALDMYGSLRRPAAAKVLALAGRLTNMAVMKAGWKRCLRNCALTALNAIPPARRNLEMSLSGLARAELSVLPKPMPESSGLLAEGAWHNGVRVRQAR